MKLFRENAGIISKDPVWVCIHGSYLHIEDTLLALLLDVIFHYHSDHNLVE